MVYPGSVWFYAVLGRTIAVDVTVEAPDEESARALAATLIAKHNLEAIPNNEDFRAIFPKKGALHVGTVTPCFPEARDPRTLSGGNLYKVQLRRYDEGGTYLGGPDLPFLLTNLKEDIPNYFQSKEGYTNGFYDVEAHVVSMTPSDEATALSPTNHQGWEHWGG